MILIQIDINNETLIWVNEKNMHQYIVSSTFQCFEDLKNIGAVDIFCI